MELTEEQMIQTAYHEAGHAVAGILLGGRNKHVGIGTLDTGGEWVQNENSTGNTLTIYPVPNYSPVIACSLLRRKIVEGYAGLIGVQVNKPVFTDYDVSTGFNDHDDIDELAHMLVSLTLSANTPEDVKETWRRQQMVALAGVAQQLLSDEAFRFTVGLLANVLMERKQLNGADATAMIVNLLATKGVTIVPLELSAYSVEFLQTVQERE